MNENKKTTSSSKAVKKAAPKATKKNVEKTLDKNTQKLIDLIVDAMDDIKAENIVTIDMKKIEDRMADFFVICHAESGVQVKSIGENILRRCRTELGEKALSKEGFENGEWILIDYIDVVAHVFRKDRREFYKIEDMWYDGIIKQQK